MAGPGRFVFLRSGAWSSIANDSVSVETPANRKDDISAEGQQDRELRAARTQALFRAVNEKIRAVNDDFAELTGSFTVACGCADPVCLEMLEIPVDVYRRVRQSPYTFVLLADHVDGAVERVVAQEDSYVVVEMPGEDARRLLDETAPARADGEEA